MRPSLVFTGLPETEEARLRDAVGADVRGLMLIGQRIVWGVTQSDLVHVDLDKQADRLLARFPGSVPAYLLAAYARRASSAAGADDLIDQARALCPPEHPLAYLVPTPGEWADEVPEQQLVNVVPDAVWRVASYAPMPGTTLPSMSSATIIRIASGELVIVNPVPVSSTVRAEIEALGPVVALAVQGKAHNKHVEESVAAFPEARVYGTRWHLKHPPAAHLEFDGLLGESGSPMCDEIDELVVDGSELGEVLLLHRPSGVLIVQDLAGAAFANAAVPFLTRLYCFAWGLVDRVGCLAYQPVMWNDLARVQAGLQRVLEQDYTAAVGAHWQVDPIRGQQLQQFNDELRWITELSAGAHLRLVLRFFFAQPGFLRDVIRYRMSVRKLAKRAKARENVHG